MASQEMNEVRQRQHATQGELNYLLELFGDALAKREGYGGALDGVDAIRFYLMEKHHWLPREVRALSYEDLHFAMSVEMGGWSVGRGA